MEATIPRQSNGVYLPPANTAAITATTISSTAYNTLETDIGTELTNSLDRLGRAAMQAALPMGGQKITGMADPTVASDAASKNYVDTTTAAFFSTGDIKLTAKITADTGWVILNDQEVGPAGSVARNRANADTLALFTLLFNSYTDAYVPVFTSGGVPTTRVAQSNSASTAWAANCCIALPRFAGRAVGIAGAGAGLTTRLGTQFLGEENHTLATAELPSVTLSLAVSGSISVTSVDSLVSGTITGNASNGVGTGFSALTSGSAASTTRVSNGSASLTGSTSFGSGTAFNVIQPTTFINAMMKL